MQRVTSIIGGRRLLYKDLFTGVRRQRRISAHRRAIFSLESRYHSHTTRCNTATSIIPFSANLAANNGNGNGPTTKHRLFWSSTDEIAEAVENDNTSTTSLLPISPITPSNISATSLLSSSTIDSLNSLPECKFVLDLLNGTDEHESIGSADSNNSSEIGVINITKVKEAHQNLSRANDILSSMPDLQISIKLLEVDLLCICGKFTEALQKLNQYELYLTKQQQLNHNKVEEGETGAYDTQQYHHGHSERDTTKHQYNTIEEANETIQRMRTKGKDPNNTLIPYYNPQLGKYLIGNDINSGTSNSMQSNILLQIQVIKSKLLCNIGQYEYALSEYENMLENMEREVERQMQRALALQQQQQQEKNNNDASSDEQKEMEMPTDTLPVIHGASALTGVGVTKLLLHLREQDTTSSTTSSTTNNNNSSEIEDIIESIQTATEILLESRTDAIKSPTHTGLAVDLGIAASISLTNLGITHVLLPMGDKRSKTKKRAMKYWRKGIQTLDLILQNAVTSTIIIPAHKFQLMESVRARLYCNIAYVLLGLDSNIDIEDGNKKLEQVVDDKALKEASDAAKKALDIYDELLNGSKMTIGDDTDEDSSDTQDVDTDKDTKEAMTTTSEEWEKILKDQASLPDEEEYDPNKKSKDIPISTLWKSYHKAESARALGLVAQCYALAGAAVTAEGLFQSALDASSSYPIGQNLSSRSKDTNTGRGVSLSSPNLGLIARDVRLWYANLCNNWDKRKGDADRLREEARMIEDEGVLKGYVRLDGSGVKRSVSGLESSLWIFSPGDFER